MCVFVCVCVCVCVFLFWKRNQGRDFSGDIQCPGPANLFSAARHFIDKKSSQYNKKYFVRATQTFEMIITKKINTIVIMFVIFLYEP